ncbi:MAG TPA: hypothetical protein VLE96_00665 [Chlamydiales bacterium]|nr:hypothetical protein [Chlamydiales bacterium]
MNLKEFSEFNCDAFSVELGSFYSIKGRWICFKLLLQKITFLPFVLCFKVLIAFFRTVAFASAAMIYVATLGSSCKAQEAFVKRGSLLAKDLGDWMMFPFIVGTGLFRLILGATLAPAVYFQ